MKWMKAVFWSALLAVVGPAFGNKPPAESPQDYAAGAILNTTGTSPWYRVALPQKVYEQTAWPDLRDVRIFNHQGEAVPFTLTLETQRIQPRPPETLPLRLFPLTVSPVPSGREESAGTESVILRAKNGLEIHLESSSVGALGKSYLLTLPDSATAPFDVGQLRLNWSTPAESWQGKASLYYSSDLRQWSHLREDVPLVDLTRNGDRLKLDTVDARLILSAAENRYLLLVLNSTDPALTLNSVTAVAAGQQPETASIALNALAAQTSETEAIWRWTHPQPLNSLSIMLENEGVLPVELAWRSGKKEPWQPLTQTVLYSVNESFNDDIPLSGKEVEAIRMTTINARLPEALPVVSGKRNSYQLVFNLQGKGPYILAWGNLAAQKADIGIDMLIPPSLQKHRNISDLPGAELRESVTLGGDERLTATSAAERQSQWKTLLVWGALILGVAVLLVMAWRIWREMSKGDTA